MTSARLPGSSEPMRSARPSTRAPPMRQHLDHRPRRHAGRVAAEALVQQRGELRVAQQVERVVRRRAVGAEATLIPRASICGTGATPLAELEVGDRVRGDADVELGEQRRGRPRRRGRSGPPRCAPRGCRGRRGTRPGTTPFSALIFSDLPAGLGEVDDQRCVELLGELRLLDQVRGRHRVRRVGRHRRHHQAGGRGSARAARAGAGERDLGGRARRGGEVDQALGDHRAQADPLDHAR